MRRDGENNGQGSTASRRRLFQRSLTIVVLSILQILTASYSVAQDSIDFVYATNGLERNQDNVIQNAAHLDEFFDALYQLRLNNDRKINIVHIGDSHIQADYLTAVVRRNFQKYFGNAGRGLIIPAKVAGTNGPFNVVTNSSEKWNSGRVVEAANPLPIGIGAITVQTTNEHARLEVYMNDLWLDYGFNALTLFFQKDESSFYFSVKDTLNKELAFIGSFTEEPFVNYSRVVFPDAVSAMSLETIKSMPTQNQAVIFGINLENDANGIRYHAIGVNGARYAHYNKASLLAAQTAALTPDLFIVSLGTNEAIQYPYLEKDLIAQIDNFISSLKRNNPKAKFMLVTPPGAFRKKNKPNPGIEITRQQIIAYAVENGFAFYDMYKAMGGDQAADTWKACGMIRSDGVHFTKDGYEYQGTLFFKAMMKSYNQYVSFRHP
jgi:lysophospholipase L1-like esterase